MTSLALIGGILLVAAFAIMAATHFAGRAARAQALKEQADAKSRASERVAEAMSKEYTPEDAAKKLEDNSF